MSEPSEVPGERISVVIRMGGEQLHFAAEIADQPVALQDLLPLFRDMTNRVVEIAIREAVAGGRQISCRSGCGACCAQLVPISLAEGGALLQIVQAMTPERQERLRQRFAGSMARLEAAGLLDRLEQALAANAPRERQAVGLDYFRLGLDCPFLEAQSCSIHPLRPLSCREFLVVSDPRHCADPSPQKVASVVLPRRVSPIVYAMGARHDPAGLGFMPLVRLFDQAETLSAPQPRESATALVREFLQRLGE